MLHEVTICLETNIKDLGTKWTQTSPKTLHFSTFLACLCVFAGFSSFPRKPNNETTLQESLRAADKEASELSQDLQRREQVSLSKRGSVGHLQKHVQTSEVLVEIYDERDPEFGM